MFGFWRKAKQDGQAIGTEVVDALRATLVRATYSVAIAREYKEGEAQFQALLERQGSMVLGFEMIRDGAHPKEIAEPRAKAAAEVARTVINAVILGRKLDADEVAIGLREILEREYTSNDAREAEAISRSVSSPFAPSSQKIASIFQ